MPRSVRPPVESRPLDLLLALALFAAFSGLLVLALFATPLALQPGGLPAAALALVALPASVALGRWRQLGPIRVMAAPSPRRSVVVRRPAQRMRRGRRLRAALAAALVAPLPR